MSDKPIVPDFHCTLELKLSSETVDEKLNIILESKLDGLDFWNVKETQNYSFYEQDVYNILLWYFKKHFHQYFREVLDMYYDEALIFIAMMKAIPEDENKTFDILDIHNTTKKRLVEERMSQSRVEFVKLRYNALMDYFKKARKKNRQNRINYQNKNKHISLNNDMWLNKGLKTDIAFKELPDTVLRALANDEPPSALAIHFLANEINAEPGFIKKC